MQTGTGGEQEVDDFVARASKTVRNTMNILYVFWPILARLFRPGRPTPVNCNLPRTPNPTPTQPDMAGECAVALPTAPACKDHYPCFVPLLQHAYNRVPRTHCQ
jgi:hypothetical protein